MVYNVGKQYYNSGHTLWIYYFLLDSWIVVLCTSFNWSTHRPPCIYALKNSTQLSKRWHIKLKVVKSSVGCLCVPFVFDGPYTVASLCLFNLLTLHIFFPFFKSLWNNVIRGPFICCCWQYSAINLKVWHSNSVSQMHFFLLIAL